MTARTINVRLPEALYNQIEELAKATARTKSFLAIDALTHYVQRESWQIRDIHEGYLASGADLIDLMTRALERIQHTGIAVETTRLLPTLGEALWINHRAKPAFAHGEGKTAAGDGVK